MKNSNTIKRVFALLGAFTFLFQNLLCFAYDFETYVNTSNEQHSSRVLSKSILNSYETGANDENSFFSLTSRIRYIDRWVLFQNLEKKEDLADHSLEVGIIAHALALIKNKKFGGNINADRAALLGMYHDMPEIVTGDIPTPTKHYDENMEKLCDQAEDRAVNEMMSLLPEEFREDYLKILKYNEKEKELWSIVKSADTLSAIIKCLREKKVGNNDFDKVLKIYTQKIVAVKDPAVAYFVKTFMPSFGFKYPDDLTLVENEW